LTALGAQIVGISVDSREDSVALAERLGLGFSLLEDVDLRVASAYGVAMAGKDIAVPAVFVIRSDRVISWKQVGETVDDRPSSATLIARVREARSPRGAG